MLSNLLKNSLGVPLHIFRHLYTGARRECALTRRHHDQRLSYGRVSLGFMAGC